MKNFLKLSFTVLVGLMLIVVFIDSPGIAILVVSAFFFVIFSEEVLPLYVRHVAALEKMAGILSPESTQQNTDENISVTMESP